MPTEAADCGKTSLFESVCDIVLKTFQNPVDSTLIWLGVQKSNSVFLN